MHDVFSISDDALMSDHPSVHPIQVEEEIEKDVSNLVKNTLGRVIPASKWKAPGSVDKMVDKVQSKPLEMKK